ncbi:efflux RND transporter periplasmic adaptor subunit [Chitinibacter tainanensis]|uniref:efflux RND transporter periplasmic adaptor subunit n=1 Tax=Chitinibacter tainanensis TaxID=230667 RepID=UPI0023552ADD|nr:efflux RND transporter periplasmic adaptor subunit [Chitinibacter tainanensis]
MNKILQSLNHPGLRQRKVWLSVLAALTVLGAGGVVVAASGKEGANAAASAPANAVLTVKLIQPKVVNWPQAISANGNVLAWQESQIGSESGGLRLIEVNAQVGDVVKKGQLLARFNDETIQAEVAQAKAAVAEAEAAQQEAQENANRVRQLGNTGSLSAQQITQALTQERTAQARVQAAKAQLTTAQVRLNQTRVLAPDEGVISARSATLGAVGQPGQELFRLVRQGRLEWQAEVTAAESGRVAAGQVASVVLANGQTLKGKVRQVAPTADLKSRNVLVYVDLASNGRLNEAKPGMFAKGQIEVGSGQALALPGSAVLLRDGFAQVFTVDANQKVKQLRVKIGRQAQGLMEVIGLPADARVVASGAGFLADGDTVRIAK